MSDFVVDMNDKIVVPKLEKKRLKDGFLMREGMRTWKNKRLLVRKDYATIVSETSIYFAFSVRDMSDEQLQQLIQWVSEGKQQWKSK